MNEGEIIDAIRAHDAVAIGGGGTRGGGDFRPAEAGVIFYSPEELVISVKAGTPLEELEAILDDKEQILAQEPMDHRVFLGSEGTPSIGGAVGVNADGLRRLRYGSLREAILGLRFVDGQGETIRAGGRVMKNVTGLDITKFFAGSHGELGVMLDVNLKLLPKPKETLSRSFEIEGEEFASQFLPLLRRPLEITGAVYSQGRVYVRQEGEMLDDLHKALRDQLGEGRDEPDEIWRELRDWHPMKAHEEVWRVFLRPLDAMNLAETLGVEFMVLSGGTELLLACDEAHLAAHLKEGQFAICEKGEPRRKRIPLRPLLHEELCSKLFTVFDPENKFGGQNAH